MLFKNTVSTRNFSFFFKNFDFFKDIKPYSENLAAYLKKQNEYIAKAQEANIIEEEIRKISLPERQGPLKSKYQKKLEKLTKCETKLKQIEKIYSNSYVSSSQYKKNLSKFFFNNFFSEFL